MVFADKQRGGTIAAMDYALPAICFCVAILTYLAALTFNSLMIAAISVLCFMSGLVITVMKGMRP